MVHVIHGFGSTARTMKSGVALDITQEEQRRVKELHPEDWYLGPKSVTPHLFGPFVCLNMNLAVF